jgi:hypothetical protein
VFWLCPWGSLHLLEDAEEESLEGDGMEDDNFKELLESVSCPKPKGFFVSVVLRDLVDDAKELAKELFEFLSFPMSVFAAFSVSVRIDY